MADSLVTDLAAAYSEGKGGRGTLDYLRIVSDTEQTAVQYRRMLSDVRNEYLEFSRPPYAVDPLDEKLVKQARLRGVTCRLLIESGTLDQAHRQRLEEYAAAGVEVGQTESLPMKLAVFDGERGMLALLESGDHQANVDGGGVRTCGDGRGDEGTVRELLAQKISGQS